MRVILNVRLRFEEHTPTV